MLNRPDNYELNGCSVEKLIKARVQVSTGSVMSSDLSYLMAVLLFDPKTT